MANRSAAGSQWAYTGCLSLYADGSPDGPIGPVHSWCVWRRQDKGSGDIGHCPGDSLP